MLCEKRGDGTLGERQDALAHLSRLKGKTRKVGRVFEADTPYSLGMCFKHVSYAHA